MFKSDLNAIQIRASTRARAHSIYMANSADAIVSHLTIRELIVKLIIGVRRSRIMIFTSTIYWLRMRFRFVLVCLLLFNCVILHCMSLLTAFIFTHFMHQVFARCFFFAFLFLFDYLY